MPSVALIGPDGAGKTTLTRMLEHSELLPFRYLYMGVAASSSNITLPTTRLAEWVKRHLEKTADSDQRTDRIMAESGGRRPRRGGLRAVARLINRLMEECYRQLVSWRYQLQGFVVLYDRHYVFDFAPEIMEVQRESLEQQLHRWWLTYLYPRPDLVIFLDAPGEVLFARKGELTVAELERRRQAFLRQGERIPNFVRVDATRPLGEVYEEIIYHVLRFNQKRRPQLGVVTR